MLGSFLAASLLLTSSIPSGSGMPSEDHVVLNQRIQELENKKKALIEEERQRLLLRILERREELENKKKALIEEERQRILNRDVAEEEKTAFKNILTQLSEQKTQLINEQISFVQELDKILGKVRGWWGQGYLRTIQTINGSERDTERLYGSYHEAASNVVKRKWTGYWYFRVNGIQSDISNTKNLYTDPTEENPFGLIKQDVVDSDSNYWSVGSNSPSDSESLIWGVSPSIYAFRMKIVGWIDLLPILEKQMYVIPIISDISEIDDSGTYTWKGMRLGRSWVELDDDNIIFKDYKLDIVASHPKYNDILASKNRLAFINKRIEELKTNLNNRSQRAIKDLTRLNQLDDDGQPYNVEMLVAAVTTTLN